MNATSTKTRPECKEADCERREFLRGWCNPHYQRWIKGRPVHGPIKTYVKCQPNASDLKPCGVEGCAGGKSLTRGLCARHYGRFRAHGDPLVYKPKGPPRIRVELPAETSPAKLGRLLGVSRQRAHQLLNKEAHNARLLLQRAVKAGAIVKPNACERCQQPKADLEAHHWDYREPLDVRWLCPPCHSVVHPHHPTVHANEKSAAQAA